MGNFAVLIVGRNYWYFIKKALKDKGVCHRETILEVRKAWWVKNQVLGKGRSWICGALNAGVLFECMQVLSYESLRYVSRFFHHRAVIYLALQRMV